MLCKNCESDEDVSETELGLLCNTCYILFSQELLDMIDEE